jgi:hypothetical protein
LKRKGLGVCIIFILLIAGISAGSFLTKDRTFSENENRYLAMSPVFSVGDFLSGDYQENLESYLNDQFFLRDGWITIKTAVQKACGDTDIGGAYVGKDGYDFEKILPEDVDDALVDRNIRAVADYFTFCTEQMDGVRVSFLLVPTSGLVLSEKLPDHAILFDQSAYIERIAEAVTGTDATETAVAEATAAEAIGTDIAEEIAAEVTDATGTAAGVCTFISPEAILRAHADEGVYYRTDHHWTTRGAFYAYQVWCEATGHTFAGEDAYTVTQVSDSFRGSLYSKILDYDSAYDTIEVMERIPGAEENGNFATDEGFGQEDFAVTADGENLAQEDYTVTADGENLTQEDYTVTADGEKLDGIYQEEYLTKKDKYAYFFGGNYGEVRISHTVKTASTNTETEDANSAPNPLESIGDDTKASDRGNLLVIKDSFANAFVPFLIPEYDNIYMIDLRYYNGDMASYIQENEITDVLVLYNVSNFISDKYLYKLARGL